MSVIIEVPIPDELIPLLEQKAHGAGLDREQYVRSIVSRAIVGPKPLAEILGSFRNEVAAIGISDEDLAELFRAER